MRGRDVLVDAVAFCVLVGAGCSARDGIIAAPAVLAQDGRTFRIDPPMAVSGHFNDVCIGLPEGGNVDIHGGVVILPSGDRARVGASLWTDRGELVDLTHLSLNIATDGRYACLSTLLGIQGGRYGRVTIASSAPFTSPRILWRSTDKL